MTALKAHQVAKFVANPDLRAGVFLSYGPDRGLVRETAGKLLHTFGGDDPDPMSETAFDASDLAADPARLAVEARTPSLFGGTRRIRVRNAARPLTATLAELLDDMPDAVIVLEAGNLTKSDPLRVLAETRGNARALPRYPDNAAALGELIRKTLGDAGIVADPDVAPFLRDTLGNDREITRMELEKLVLYAAETRTLSRAEVSVLCGDNTALALDAILDAAGTGRADTLDRVYSSAVAGGLDIQRLLIAALFHFTWLRRLRAVVDTGRSPRDVLDAERPRPHFSRKAALEQQLRLWTDEALAQASNRVYEAIADSRKTPALSGAIAHRAILAIGVAAAYR